MAAAVVRGAGRAAWAWWMHDMDEEERLFQATRATVASCGSAAAICLASLVDDDPRRGLLLRRVHFAATAAWALACLRVHAAPLLTAYVVALAVLSPLSTEPLV